MDWMVSLILRFMTTQGVIAEDDETQNFYRYGIEITISSFVNIINILLIGIVTGEMFASIVFLLIFICLRSFTGGYHAKTYLKCILLLSVSFTVVDMLYKIINLRISKILIIISLAFSIITLLLFCPIENSNKPLGSDKKRCHKIISLVLFCLSYGISHGLIINNHSIGTVVFLTLQLIIFFVWVSILKEKRCNNEKGKTKDSCNC